METSLIQKIAVTYEMVGGKAPSEAVARAMVSMLDGYEPQRVSDALDRCLAEVKGHLSPSDIIQRIDDGRPDASAAWALVPKSENDSAVWNDEISQAYGDCYSLISDGDIAGAKFAFMESYKKRVSLARAKGAPVKWTFSAGFDKTGRSAALSAAYEKKLLPVETIMRHLPYDDSGEQLREKIEREMNLLTDGGSSESEKQLLAGIGKSMSLPWEK